MHTGHLCLFLCKPVNVRMRCSLLILSSSPDPNSEHVLRILRKSHVSSVLVNFLIRSFRGLWTLQRRVIPVRKPALRHRSMTQNVKCGSYNICVGKINFTLKSLHFIITKIWPPQWKSSNCLLSAHGKCSSLIYTQHVCTWLVYTIEFTINWTGSFISIQEANSYEIRRFTRKVYRGYRLKFHRPSIVWYHEFTFEC